MNRLERRFPLYSYLLKLYPPAYKAEDRQQMLQTLADMLDNAPTQQQQVGVWLRVFADLPYSLAKENILYTGSVMAHDMPRYVKRNSLLGACLLVPFFILVAAHAANSQSLQASIFWHTHVLFVWLILLPVLAGLITSSSFAYWLQERHRQSPPSSLWRELFDLRRNWPMLIVLAAALGILAIVFGHDSVHCLTGNPIAETQNYHQTWRCIQQR